jgi:hypothetical protein
VGVVLADERGAAVVQLHDMRQIRLAENMDHGYAGGRKALLHGLNQIRLGQGLGADLNVIETGMQPMVDVALEGYYAARQSQDCEEDRRADA